MVIVNFGLWHQTSTVQFSQNCHSAKMDSGQKLNDVGFFFFLKERCNSDFILYILHPTQHSKTLHHTTCHTQSVTQHPTVPQQEESMWFFIFHLSAPSDTGGPLPQKPQRRSITALLWPSHGRHISQMNMDLYF